MSSMYPEDDVTTQPAADQATAGFDAWLAELQQERLENWRNEAIAQYPAVASLREYLTAETKGKTLELAKDLAEKLGRGQTPTPGAAVGGGSPAIGRHPGDQEYTQERAMEDIRNGVDRELVFQNRLAQKFHDTGQLAPWES